MLNNISFSVAAGDILCLLGPSGCGKTTLVNLIMGVDVPISGTVRVLEEAAPFPTARARIAMIREGRLITEALGEGRGEAADEMEATIADKRAEVEEAIDGANQQREEARTALEGVTISMPAEARAGLAEALGGLFDDDAALSFSTEDLSMNASNYLPIEDMETAYLHGNEDWRMFDCYGPVFIGFPNEGNVGLVVFTCITMAMVSVALGLLVSGLATTPFQVIQLILLFVVPQILLCGANLATVGFDLAILWGFLALFFTLAAASFRKKRA